MWDRDWETDCSILDTKESNAWQKYIKRWEKLSKGDHTYFAVREAGERSGRLHIHSIHCIKHIPDSWKKDPNDANWIPTSREIPLAKKLWAYGWSAPIAVRFGLNDPWTKLNWRWPVEIGPNETETPVEATQPQKLAYYLAKYLTGKAIGAGTSQVYNYLGGRFTEGITYPKWRLEGYNRIWTGTLDTKHLHQTWTQHGCL